MGDLSEVRLGWPGITHFSCVGGNDVFVALCARLIHIHIYIKMHLSRCILPKKVRAPVTGQFFFSGAPQIYRCD